jgi:hypothetical protein
LFGKYGKIKVYKCYYTNGVRIFQREKKNLHFLPWGYFRLNGEEKLENGVLIILLSNLAKLKTIDVDMLN